MYVILYANRVVCMHAYILYVIMNLYMSVYVYIYICIYMHNMYIHL